MSLTLSLLLRSPDPVVSPSSRLKLPADKLDRALHAGAILLGLAQPRQFHQLDQFIQTGIQGGWLIYHALPSVSGGERFQISRPTKDMESLVSAVGYP
jgi:hypothetical protein